MTGKKTQLLSIWGDTVDFRQFLLGTVGGAVLGYASFQAGVRYLAWSHPAMQKGILMGYALLFGVAGCVLAGVIAAKLFPPKHVYREQELATDRSAVLKELKVDMAFEAECLKHAPEKVIREMKALQIYELFAGDESAASTDRKGAR